VRERQLQKGYVNQLGSPLLMQREELAPQRVPCSWDDSLASAAWPPAQKTGYSARLWSAGGEELAQAAVYLYHPPFAIDLAISYIAEEGAKARAKEMFKMPRGWGVLRSQCGLLLWLRLNMDAKMLANPSCLLGGEIRLEFVRTAAAEGEGRLDISAQVVGVPCDLVQLSGDKGLLHPSAELSGTQVQLQLDPEFGALAKAWLSKMHRVSTRLSS